MLEIGERPHLSVFCANYPVGTRVGRCVGCNQVTWLITGWHNHWRALSDGCLRGHNGSGCHGNEVSFSKARLCLSAPMSICILSKEHWLPLTALWSISFYPPPTSLTQFNFKWCVWCSFLSRVCLRHLVGGLGGCSWMLNECIIAGSWEKAFCLPFTGVFVSPRNTVASGKD